MCIRDRYAATPENTVFVHSISNDGLAYNVWFNGVVGDQFAIADAAGNTVAKMCIRDSEKKIDESGKRDSVQQI